jgi:restriction system protein
MAIPNYQSVMLPLSKLVADDRERSLREAIDPLADEFSRSEAERTEMLPSGQQAIFTNRVGWVRTYLKRVGLIESPRSGFFMLNPPWEPSRRWLGS